MPRIEIKPERRADVTYSAHDGNLWVLPLTTAGISYCRSAMPAGAQRMGMYYLIGAGDATRVLCGLHADGGLVARQVGGPPVRMPLQHPMQGRGAAWTYKIVRGFFRGGRRTIARGLTLEQAQEHCRDPETSSTTCRSAAGKRRTRKLGPWFDGYERE